MKSIVFLLSAWFVSGMAHAEIPRLFQVDEVNPVFIAEAINHYVDLGEPAALEELSELSKESDIGAEHRKRQIKVGWILRTLYMPVGKGSLRGPYYGAAMFPHYRKESWPLFPLVASGKSYFILDETLIIGGSPEDPSKYLEYCRTNGRFRTQRIDVPTSRQALEDAFSLRSSPAWKALKWKDSGLGWSYEYSEAHAWAYIENQARSIDQGKDVSHAR